MVSRLGYGDDQYTLPNLAVDIHASLTTELTVLRYL
jgi:hypothetical protein